VPSKYPGATFLPSSISHSQRSDTWGVVIHWTVGHESGDIRVLRGPNVDVQFYVAKSGKVYQFLDAGSKAFHAFGTANDHTIGIETEGSGEAWTDAQFDSVVDLSAWIAKNYSVPVRHVDPSAGDTASFRGFFGHRDLSVGGVRVDGNTHTDTVPAGTGWNKFLVAVANAVHPKPVTKFYYEELPWPRGTAPRFFGPWKSGAVQDFNITAMRKLGRVVSAYKGGLYWWKKGTFGQRWRFGPYSTKAERDNRMKNRAHDTGRTMRPYNDTFLGG